MYLRLCSILHASKDDFELLASKLSVVGSLHAPLCWVLYSTGIEARVLHTKQALSTN